MDNYEAKAASFLKRHNMKLEIRTVEDRCPDWGVTSKSEYACPNCGSVHGNRYRITIRRKDPEKYPSRPKIISFYFWGSYNDKLQGNRPTAYDVLASLDPYIPDNFVDFVEYFGYTNDLRAAEKIFVSANKLCKRLHKFFTDKQMEELTEIA